MTKRLFQQLNQDLTPSPADFQREFDSLIQIERRISIQLLDAIKGASDKATADRLVRVIRSAALVTSPASFYESVINDIAASATNDHSKHAFNVLKSLL